jgi:two-component system cell cycle sensor histidine kinase/response regulator CckA
LSRGSEEAREGPHESQRMLASLMSNLPGVAFRCLNDHDWTNLFMSEGCYDLTGYQAADLVGNARLSFDQLIHPADRERVWQEIQTALADERRYKIRYRIESADGVVKWVWEQGRGIYDDDDHLLFIEGLTIDISEQIRAEEALRESEERYRRLFELESDAIILVDSESGRILEANPAATTLYGYSRDEWLAMKYPEMSAEPDESRKAVNERRTQVPLRWHRKKDGVVFPVEVAVSHFEWGGRDMHVGTMRDISERKRAEAAMNEAEERLRQSQKMEAVGQLAGGIAHDFNNLLTAILGYSEMILATGLSNPDEVRADLEQIKKAAERAKALTGQILTFSRRQPREPEVASLNILIREFEPLLRRALGEDVTLRCVLAPDAGLVEIDPSQFTQVLMNLAVNARDAMPDGGALTLETTNAEVTDGDPRAALGLQPGSWFELSVSDVGVGMDEATLERIFEPFFTTKAPGQGTGLGLATVYGIVQQSGGEIFVNSEPGEGATFELYFPIVDEPASHVTPCNEPKRSATGEAAGEQATGSGHGETILVVEDEPGVRALAARILRNEGYRVILACDGPQAVALAEDREISMDLLLTDVVLPERLQGDEVARRVCAERPGLRSIFMSGYPRESIVHSGRLDEGINYLAKPFTPDALAKRVREVLDAD